MEASKSLAGIAVFDGLDEAERRRLEARCKWRRYLTGETVVEHGSKSRQILFIVEGSVIVVNFSSSGREVSYATLTTGEYFGELSAIDGRPRSANVVAVEPTFLAALASERFIELLGQQAGVTLKVLVRLAAMVRSGDERIMDLSTLAATHRVYGELLRMARPDPAATGRWMIHPMPPLREVASRVSTTRETVARALGLLYPTGLARRKGKCLYLPDRAKFEAVVTGLRLENG